MLTNWKPFDDFDKIVESMMNQKAPIGIAPSVDIYEKGNNLIIDCPMPGMHADKVEISIENNILTLQGKMEKKSEVEEKDYFRREIRSGSFFRQIPLPANVQGEKASASYEDGILKIAVPKVLKSKSKKIDIKVKLNKKY